MSTKKMFVFGKELYDRGLKYGCKYEDTSLVISQENKEVNNLVKAIFISSSLDSQNKENIWNRLQLDFDISGDSNIEISYYASDNNYIIHNDEKIEIDSIIHDEKISVKDKNEFLDTFWIEKIKNPKDMLLYKAKGQYLWLKIEMNMYGNNTLKINKLVVDKEYKNMIEFLPEFYKTNYSNDLFLHRFLGIYQSIVSDMQDKIDDISKYLDIDFVDNEYLYWLSTWVCIDDATIIKKDKLKLFIKNSFELYKLKGTIIGMKKLVEIFTNKEPIIIETYKLINFYDKMEYDSTYSTLYGKDVYTFNILITDDCIKNQQDFIELSRVVDIYKPSFTKVNIIVLKPFMSLGQHSYIGINSNITSNSTFVLGDNSNIPFNTTILE